MQMKAPTGNSRRMSLGLSAWLLAVVALVGLAQAALGSERATTSQRPGIVPLCRQPPVCTRRSPRVCGRLANGLCRRFSNVCELLKVNERDVSPARTLTWTPTQERDCRRVRNVGARYATWCQQDCPRRPLQCRRTPRAQEICVRSRDLRTCRVLANRCQLLNANCFTRPRNNWMPTSRRLCGQMKMGDRPRACRTRIATRGPLVTIRPVLPRPPIRVASNSSTTRRPPARA